MVLKRAMQKNFSREGMKGMVFLDMEVEQIGSNLNIKLRLFSESVKIGAVFN